MIFNARPAIQKTLTSISGQTELRRRILAEFRDPTLSALKSLAMRGFGNAGRGCGRLAVAYNCTLPFWMSSLKGMGDSISYHPKLFLKRLKRIVWPAAVC